MACRFPGAPDLDAYWDLLSAGRDAITRFPADPDQQPDFVDAKGVIDDPLAFDWSQFRYTRGEAATIDPQQRVFLQCAATAIDDAGLDPSRFSGWIGCYAGCDYTVAPPDPALDALTLVIGRDKDFLATRVAYKLGLRGPAMTVQTACSTSLCAVHVATQSLLGYECDVALAGGVTVTGPAKRGYVYREGGILSPDGCCRPFDAGSAGTVPSEGVGVVVLKRLDDALRDRDRLIAVIHASSVNNDGGEKVGYTAPSTAGQRDVIRLAQQVAGIDPVQVGYVEAHGTATRIGDLIEIQGLAEAFGLGPADHTCWLGSVKGNIGHTGAAAGVAGLIKTALMLQRREIAPTAHFRRPSSLLHLDETPFRIATERRPWPSDAPYAGVSSFGVGGTNVHAVLGPAPRRDRGPASGRAQLMVLSATTPPTLRSLRESVGDYLEREAGLRPADVAWTLAGRRRLGHRHVAVARTVGEAADHLRRQGDEGRAFGGVEPRVAFLFPGQGALRQGAAAAAYHRLPGFPEPFDEVTDVVERRCSVDLTPVVGGDASPGWFTDTVHQQLGLLAIGYAAAGALSRSGIEPEAMLGNSIGEYVAATVARAWSLEDAVAVVHARAKAMRESPPGRMLAVQASPVQVAGALVEHSGVSLAVRHKDSVVLSGAVEAVGTLTRSGVLAGVESRFIETRHAFHSSLMQPAAEQLTRVLRGVAIQRPCCPVVSNVTGDWAQPERIVDPDYWAEHLLRTVRLDNGVSTLLSSGCNVFVELGPGASMVTHLLRDPEWRTELCAVPLMPRPSGDAETQLLRALGQLWARGLDVPLEELARSDEPWRCHLPTHPFPTESPEKGRGPRSESPRRETVQVPPGDDIREVLADLWCRAVAAPGVNENDDFLVAGGESLGMVQLLGWIRDETGWEIPVSDFAAAPTFGRLVELARAAGAHDDTPLPTGLVKLADGGAGDPLFLIGDGFGTTVGYQALAHRLGRQVFGLEFSDPVKRIEELAEANAALLRRWSGTPIVLGGWSFGAIVAHETARRLPDVEIRRLLLLDGYVPDTGGRPIATHRRLLASVVRTHCDVLLRRGRIGRHLAQAPSSRQQLLGNLRAMLRYRPNPLPLPVSVFKAGGEHEQPARLERELAPLYRGGVRVYPVAGDHWSMLQHPHVTALAELIRAEFVAEQVMT
jgi:phthiocerol/phenolphthiocerol synthesis type-I polyketide synthase E